MELKSRGVEISKWGVVLGSWGVDIDDPIIYNEEIE